MYSFGVQKIDALWNPSGPLAFCNKRLLLFDTIICFFILLSQMYTLTSYFFLHTWGLLICTKSIQTLVPWVNISGTTFANTQLNDEILPLLKVQVGYLTSTWLLQYQGFSLSTGTLVKGLTWIAGWFEGNLLRQKSRSRTTHFSEPDWAYTQTHSVVDLEEAGNVFLHT